MADALRPDDVWMDIPYCPIMHRHVTPSGITVEFRQHDFMPGFAAYLHQEGKPFPDGKAFCAIDLSAILLSHTVTDGTPAELAEIIADTMVHEVIHVIEAWAGAEFSEARVEGLISRYRGHASGYGDAAADAGMDFSSALYLARTEGARIRRTGWDDDSCWRIEGDTLKAQVAAIMAAERLNDARRLVKAIPPIREMLRDGDP